MKEQLTMHKKLSLRDRAAEDLAYIRSAMDRVEGSSSVSGLGGILMGSIALVTAVLSRPIFDLQAQLLVWIYAAAIAVVVGGLTSWLKVRRQASHIPWDPVRRFCLCLIPNVGAAAAVTVALWHGPGVVFLPAMWMLFYGCGVLAAGTYAVLPVRLMGLCFILGGVIALWMPMWGVISLGLTFGGLHIVFGAWVYFRHGG